MSVDCLEYRKIEAGERSGETMILAVINGNQRATFAQGSEAEVSVYAEEWSQRLEVEN